MNARARQGGFFAVGLVLVLFALVVTVSLVQVDLSRKTTKQAMAQDISSRVRAYLQALVRYSDERCGNTGAIAVPIVGLEPYVNVDWIDIYGAVAVFSISASREAVITLAFDDAGQMKDKFRALYIQAVDHYLWDGVRVAEVDASIVFSMPVRDEREMSSQDIPVKFVNEEGVYGGQNCWE